MSTPAIDSGQTLKNLSRRALEVCLASMLVLCALAKEAARAFDRDPDVRGRYRNWFGPGWYFEFLGEPIESLYTRTNVYSLDLVETGAARIAEVAAKPPAKGVPAAYYLDTVTIEDGAGRNPHSVDVEVLITPSVP